MNICFDINLQNNEATLGHYQVLFFRINLWATLLVIIFIGHMTIAKRPIIISAAFAISSDIYIGKLS